MRHHVEQYVRVSFDPKVETPIAGYSGLPSFVVVFFGMERGMPEVFKEERELLIKRPLDDSGRILI
jgi:hypothetical protein